MIRTLRMALVGGLLLVSTVCAQPSRPGEDRWEETTQLPRGIYFDVHFLDERTGWIAGSQGALAATTDGGKTWTALRGAGSGKDRWNGVRFLDVRRGVVVGGLAGPEGGLPARVVSTEDGGATWKDQTPESVKGGVAAFNGIQFLSETEGFIFGERLLATRDGGKSWQPVGEEQRRIRWLRSMFATPKIGWTIDRGNVFKTEDGGVEWKPTSASAALEEEERIHGDLNQLHFRDERNGWVWTAWNRILRTQDGGLTWKVLVGPRPGALQHTVQLDDLHGWAILEKDETFRVMRTDDGGKTWAESYSTRRRLTRLFFLRPDLGWVVGDGVVARFTPGR